MERPKRENYKKETIYSHLKIFSSEKYMYDLEIYCNKLESSYNKLLEQVKNSKKL